MYNSSISSIFSFGIINMFLICLLECFSCVHVWFSFFTMMCLLVVVIVAAVVLVVVVVVVVVVVIVADAWVVVEVLVWEIEQEYSPMKFFVVNSTPIPHTTMQHIHYNAVMHVLHKYMHYKCMHCMHHYMHAMHTYCISSWYNRNNSILLGAGSCGILLYSTGSQLLLTCQCRLTLEWGSVDLFFFIDVQ